MYALNFEFIIKKFLATRKHVGNAYRLYFCIKKKFCRLILWAILAFVIYLFFYLNCHLIYII